MNNNLISMQHDRIEELETRMRHNEKFQSELIAELNLYKKALWYAVVNINVIRLENYAEAKEVAPEYIKIYLRKARQCPDIEEVAL